MGPNCMPSLLIWTRKSSRVSPGIDRADETGFHGLRSRSTLLSTDGNVVPHTVCPAERYTRDNWVRNLHTADNDVEYQRNSSPCAGLRAIEGDPGQGAPRVRV